MSYRYCAELADFGSIAANKHIIVNTFLLEGTSDGAVWSTIPSDQYSVLKKEGLVDKRALDDSDTDVDWDDYVDWQDAGHVAFRATYTVVNGTGKTTYTQKDTTFADADESLSNSTEENYASQNEYDSPQKTGNWDVGIEDAYTISADNGAVKLNSQVPYISLGAAATAFGTGVGIWQGKDSGTYKWRVGDPAGNKAQWDGSTFSVTGTITATAGTIGGFTIASSTISVTNFTLDSTNKKITLGSGTDVITLDAADATYRLAIGHSTYSSAPFRVTKAGAVTASNIDLAGGSVSGTFTVSGTLRSAASPNPRYELTSVGLKTYDSGNTQRTQILNDGSGWLGSSSVFSWTAAGVVTLNGSAVVGNSLDADKVTFSAPTISGLTLTNNSPSGGSVAWSSFKLTYQGTTYTIASGNTSNKYIYWKKATSTTVLQSGASIPSNAVDMFMVAVNLSGTAYQSNFAPFIYGDYIAAGTISATHISVANLAAINADLGSITAGTITGAIIRTAASGARTEMQTSNVLGLGFGGIGGTDGSVVQWYARADTGRLSVGGTQEATVHGVGLRSGVDLTVGNTTTETSFVSQMVRANALNTIGGVHVKVWGTWLNNTAGTRTLTIRLKFGATTIFSPSVSLTTSATTGHFEVEVYLVNASATNSQKAIMHTVWFRGSANIDETRASAGTAAEDTTGDLTFAISAQWDSASANATLTMKQFFGEIMP